MALWQSKARFYKCYWYLIGLLWFVRLTNHERGQLKNVPLLRKQIFHIIFFVWKGYTLMPCCFKRPLTSRCSGGWIGVLWSCPEGSWPLDTEPPASLSAEKRGNSILLSSSVCWEDMGVWFRGEIAVCDWDMECIFMLCVHQDVFAKNTCDKNVCLHMCAFPPKASSCKLRKLPMC